MKQLIAAFGLFSLVAVGTPSNALAAFGALLDPTASAIACTVDVTVCESNGFGAATSLKIARTTYIGVDLSNLIVGQTYLAANNDVGLESCAGVLTSFVIASDGGANFTVAVAAVGEFVSICREEDGVLVPVLTGQMGRLTGKK